MINLKNTTFIIPIRIDSADRAFNFKYVLNYLCTNLSTNIIIKESDEKSHISELLQYIDKKQTNIIHQFEKNNTQIFHRTRLLNEMLFQVKTPVVVNYDIDVLLQPETYLQATNEIINNGYDLVYPYFRGMSQIRIDDKKALDSPLSFGEGLGVRSWNSICGHCQFFKTESYRAGGMENENFISWGPEDSERMYRFIKLGYKVTWLNNHIWHIEHERGINSEEKNPHFWDNKRLYETLNAMAAPDLENYYINAEYLIKYPIA